MDRNRTASLVIIAFALIFLVIIALYTIEIKTLNAYLHKDCNLPDNVCPYKVDIPHNSVLALTADALLLGFGVYLFFRKDAKVPVVSLPSIKRPVSVIPKGLETDEKSILEIIQKPGAIFQSELVEKSGFGKVKVTRILDKLETKGLVERKRRGMTNMVVIKQTGD